MPAGAPIGNKNAAKSRIFEQAIIRALKQRDLEAGDGETLRKIADKLIDLAMAGEVSNTRELADRLDGKPAQQVALTGAEGGAIESNLTVRFIEKDTETPA